MCSEQNARSTVTCIKCRKTRVVYVRQKLSDRETIALAIALSELEYTCDAALLPSEMSLSKRVRIRANLSSAVPIEVPFYGRGLGDELGDSDPCVYVRLKGEKQTRN